MRRMMRGLLALALTWAAGSALATEPVLHQSRTFCASGGSSCGHKIEVFRIDPANHRFQILTASRSSKARADTELLYDSMINHARKFAALAVFTGGRTPSLSKSSPYGLLRLRGIEFFGSNPRWGASAYVCILNNWVEIVPHRDGDPGRSDCVQSGNVLYEQGMVWPAIERRITAQRMAGLTRTTEVAATTALATMSDGTALYIYTERHSSADLYNFFRGFTLGRARVVTAVQMGGTGTAGYVVRTTGSAKLGGATRALVPSALAVFAR